MDKVVRWIHVSDWHVNAPLGRDTKDVLSALIQDVRLNVSQPASGSAPFQPDFVVHTGDIAFSGRAEEYSAAIPFLQGLMNAANLKIDRLFVVPGNHDVDDKAAVSADSLLAACDETSYSEACRDWYDSVEQRQMLLKRFHHFYSAFAPLIPPNHRANDQTPYFTCRLEISNRALVGIVGLNSVLASRKDDETAHRRMVLGRWQVEEAATSLNAAGSCDLRIALLHHPLTGLTTYDEPQSTNALQSNSLNMVLRGHCHAPATILQTTPDGTLAIIAAGSSYENRWSLNGYLQVEANLSTHALTIWFRRWDTRLSNFVPDTGAYKNVKADGSYEFALPPKAIGTAAPLPSKPTRSPLVLMTRCGLAVPESGLERFGIFSGYVDRESHREIAEKIQYQLGYDRTLENKYLFWHVDSRRLYYECLQEPHYTIARDSEATFKASLGNFLQHLLSHWPNKTYTFVSLGVGSGVKEKWLLEELRSQNSTAQVSLILVDINNQMLQWAMNQFRVLCDPGSVRALFWHADFDRLPHIDALLPETDGPIVFLLLGGLFGNQPMESAFLKTLCRIANDRSYLFMGIQTLDAIAGDPTLAGYGTETAFRFVEVTLSKFDPDYNTRTHQIGAHITDLLPSDVSGAETITVVAESSKFGSTRLGFSRRYDRKQLADFLTACKCPIKWDSGSASRTYWKVLVKLQTGVGR